MSNINKDVFARNLNKYLNISGKTQISLANDLGYSKAIVSEWFSGKKFPRIDALQKLADYFDVLKTDLIEDKEHLGYSNSVRIPVLGKVTCGDPIQAYDEIIGYEEIPPSLSSSGSYFGLKAIGKSMEPMIMHDDVLIVRKQDTAENGDIVIVRVNSDDATCKKIVVNNHGVTLVPLNSDFDPSFYSPSEISSLPVTIVGKVIEIRRKL